MKRGDLLAVSIALTRLIKKHSGRRVAVVLPPEIGAVVANAAITLADKTPVNLNFTVGRAELQSAIQQSEIRLAISAEPVIKRLQEFPWPEKVYRLENLVAGCKAKIAFLAHCRTADADVVDQLFARPSQQGWPGRSGYPFHQWYSGKPKGVVLSHRNIISNVMQFRSVVNLDRTDTLTLSNHFKQRSRRHSRDCRKARCGGEETE